MSERGKGRPPRPSIPFALWLLVLAIVLERSVLLAGFRHRMRLGTAELALLALLAVSCGVCMLLSSNRGFDMLSKMLAGTFVALVAIAVSVVACERQATASDALSSYAVSHWTIVIESDCTQGGTGYRCRGRVVPDGTRAGEGFAWLVLPEPIERGSSLRCVGRFSVLKDDDYGRSSWIQGICGSVRVVRVTSCKQGGGVSCWAIALRRRALAAIGATTSDERALLAGCVLGYRAALDERELVDTFALCGLSHLIAVSGAHLALMASLLARVLEVLELGPRKRVAVLVVTTGAFVAVCGAPISAIRAWLMSVAAFGAQLAGRRSHGLSSVAVIGLLMMLADPTLAGQLGFLLSVCSVASLCVFSSYACYVLCETVPVPRLPRRLGGGTRRRVHTACATLREVVAATIVCQIATLPLTLETFGRVSIVAPLANVLVGPLVSALVPLGVIACLCMPVCEAGRLALAVSDVVAKAVIVVVGLLSRVPLSSLSIASVGSWLGVAWLVLALLLVIWWPAVDGALAGRGMMAVAALLLVLYGWWRLGAPARIVVLDVGQGDAILVQDGAHAVLVDAGPDDRLAAALVRNHVLHLDAVVITHLHDDHYAGLSSILGTVPCDRVLVAHGAAAAMTKEQRHLCQDVAGDGIVELSYGDVLKVGRFSLRMVWPTTKVDGSLNEHSIELVVLFRHGGRSLSALLTGDAEREQTGACIATGDVGDIDLLKVGHHGSEASLTTEEVQTLRPEVAVASAGEGNEYGHPRKECVSMLVSGGAHFLCTKDVGDVEVRPGTLGPVVRCQRAPVGTVGEVTGS